MNHCLRFRSRRLSAGYSLIEVVIASAIIALVYGVCLKGYIQSGLRAEWGGYSLAAQSMATEQIEQARSAIWDPATTNKLNEITNLGKFWPSWTYTSSNQTWSGYNTNILDVPYGTTNFTLATNFVSVKLINCNYNTSIVMQVIQVDTVWPFRYRGGSPCFTNTACTVLAPDNRDPSSL